jgi:hypothetical protein
MPCFVALLIVVTLIVLVTCTLAGPSGSMRSSKAYHVLAARYRGNVHRTGWFGHPRVLFQYRATGVLVGVFQRGVSQGTRGRQPDGSAVRAVCPWCRGTGRASGRWCRSSRRCGRR